MIAYFLYSQRTLLESPWVQTEVETAYERERRYNQIVLFPIKIDDAVTTSVQSWAADIRRTRHIGDFRLWRRVSPYASARDRLLRDLQSGILHPDGGLPSH